MAVWHMRARHTSRRLLSFAHRWHDGAEGGCMVIWRPALPNALTLDELGIKDAESDTFQGVYAPAGTPKPLIDRLAKELDGILARADVREKFAKIGLPVVAEGPDVFRARIAKEVPMYKEIIDKAGLKMR
jgi:tripartite-type tricarboxylate transporter receptor subunit TctC